MCPYWYMGLSLFVNAFMSLQYLLISMVKAITATSNFSKLILPSVLIGKGFVCILLMDIYGLDLHSLAFGRRITSLNLSCHVSLLVNAFMSLLYLLISMVKAMTARHLNRVFFAKLILPCVLTGIWVCLYW
jgi:hypothetical protein